MCRRDSATIMDGIGGKYAGMDRYEARNAMVADLEAQGLLVKAVSYTHLQQEDGAQVCRSDPYRSCKAYGYD